MKRRSFIESSLLALLTKPAFAANGGSPGEILRTPARVFARVASGEIRLPRVSKGFYAANGVEVRVVEQAPFHRILIRAPSASLEEVRLEWPEDAPLRVLNDHWERTYGDVGWQRADPGLLLPWYFLAERRSGWNSFGVKTRASALAHWRYADGGRHLMLDTRTGGVGVQLGPRELHAADIVALAANRGESPFKLLRRLTKLMCDAPRLPAARVYGINDWYFAYGNTSDSLIKTHTELMAPMADGLSNRPFSIIDAGWFEPPTTVSGDCCFGRRMDVPNERFPDMKSLVGSIQRLGMRAGIWTRPLCADQTDRASTMLPSIAGRDDPHRPILDPTIPEVQERIRDYFRQYREWGFELVKIDFTTFDIFGKWGFEMIRDRRVTEPGWRMHDVSRTNAEIINSLYSTMREAAGDVYLIGCNTFSHLSAGVFEINRIGDDTSGREWDRTRKMGVNTLAFRGAHHGNFYAADADCVGLTTKISWEKNRQWMDLLARSATPLFISAQPAAVQSTQRLAIKEAFRVASEQRPLAEPVDWLTTSVPERWLLGEGAQHYDWA
jgi:alpha-galactosidase